MNSNLETRRLPMNRTGSSDYVARRRFLQNQAHKRGLSSNYFSQKAHEKNPSLPRILLHRAAQNQLEPIPQNTSLLSMHKPSARVTFRQRGTKSIEPTHHKVPVKNLVSTLKRFKCQQNQYNTMHNIPLSKDYQLDQPAQQHYVELDLGSPVRKKRQTEDSWIDDLYIFKRVTTTEKKYQQGILDNVEAITGKISERLLEARPLMDDILRLKESLEEIIAKFRWMLEKEDAAVAERDCELNEEQRAAAMQRRLECLAHFNAVKEQIRKAMAEAARAEKIAREEARKKREAAILRAKENNWRQRGHNN